ncbi:hypothetical protein [Anaerosacchariphilus polymeriproducens]|uniref:HK97 gp10 family phage protein n=1 Tax=Anaerosacchariphilus polymeriproducens TaxID=1812858 RepID=A0A371ARK8_9FIRM|nr:hypothetical protein [Anaerosacchariphilus polymeriproducens]RDU22208.1 hypothetical protein DWV06_16925 [Anaerosacchariphilus polymeriproducens]
MIRTTFELNDQDVELLKKQIIEYGDGAERVINDYLHNEAAVKMMRSIESRLPQSNRSWKTRKTAPASSTQPFIKETYNLSVVVRTKTDYNYLYFPDDGSNTKRHRGNQQFMQRGVDAVANELRDEMITRLVRKAEEVI